MWKIFDFFSKLLLFFGLVSDVTWVGGGLSENEAALPATTVLIGERRRGASPLMGGRKAGVQRSSFGSRSIVRFQGKKSKGLSYTEIS